MKLCFIFYLDEFLFGKDANFKFAMLIEIAFWVPIVISFLKFHEHSFRSKKNDPSLIAKASCDRWKFSFVVSQIDVPKQILLLFISKGEKTANERECRIRKIYDKLLRNEKIKREKGGKTLIFICCYGIHRYLLNAKTESEERTFIWIRNGSSFIKFIRIFNN